MTYASSSHLFRAAAGLAPVASSVTDHDDWCVKCGVALPAGTAANPVTKTTFTPAFTNAADLRAKTGRHVCWNCQALWGTDWLQKYAKTFACRHGVYRFASNDQQAAFLLNPPEPPFAAIFSTRKAQHMIWRTPLSLSREHMIVRVDNDLLTIRHAALMRGLDAYLKAEAIMADTPLERTGRKLKKPAALFSRDLAMATMGNLRPDVEQLLEQTDNAWIIQVLADLTMGEWWALNVVRHYDPRKPPPYQRAIEVS